MPVVRALVATRANLLVSGATGSGKTTLLAALLSLVPHDERLVIVEEAGELAPAHPHVVRLLARHANVDGAGRVDLADLVRHALRMRPDRIVLGECRGAEVREVLAALNTGHDGGCATVHANAAADVPARLEALAALAGMSRDAVAAQAASAFDAVLHLRRAERRVRRRGRRRRRGAGRATSRWRARCGSTRPVPAATGPAWPALAARLGLTAGPARDRVGTVSAPRRAAGGARGPGRRAGGWSSAPSRGARAGAAGRPPRTRAVGPTATCRRSCSVSPRSCGRVRHPAAAWSRVLGPSAGPVPTADALAAVTSRTGRRLGPRGRR